MMDNWVMRTGYIARQAPAVSMRIVLAMALALMLASCAGVPRADFTEEEQGIAEIPGMPGVRFFADAPARTVAGVLGKDAILQATRENNGRFEMLALSGGAWDGAYGAGILNGWTQTGSRPKFVVVTGVSAGALIAPLAFMGPEYDTALKDAFTSGIADPLSDGTDNLLAVVGERGARRDALRALVSSFVDEKFLQAVAAGHKRGRLASGCHHQSRRSAHRGLEHGCHRLIRRCAGAGTVPGCADGVMQRSGSVRANAHRGDGRQPPVRGVACRRRRYSERFHAARLSPDKRREPPENARQHIRHHEHNPGARIRSAAGACVHDGWPLAFHPPESTFQNHRAGEHGICALNRHKLLYELI